MTTYLAVKDLTNSELKFSKILKDTFTIFAKILYITY